MLEKYKHAFTIGRTHSGRCDIDTEVQEVCSLPLEVIISPHNAWRSIDFTCQLLYKGRRGFMYSLCANS